LGKFWWGCKDGKRKTCWVAWDDMTQPKDCWCFLTPIDYSASAQRISRSTSPFRLRVFRVSNPQKTENNYFQTNKIIISRRWDGGDTKLKMVWFFLNKVLR
jgi:hypothetical protein